MGENLLDDLGILETGNDSRRPVGGLGIDAEGPVQVLSDVNDSGWAASTTLADR